MRYLQITTDCSVFDRSVLRVLFAYFDESVASIIVYNAWRSWNTVGLTPIKIKNEFITVP